MFLLKILPGLTYNMLVHSSTTLTVTVKLSEVEA